MSIEAVGSTIASAAGSLQFGRVTSPVQAHAETIRRMVRKSEPLAGSSQGWTVVECEETKPELNLEDLGLAEIFPKAA